ncbi:MAG: methyl-accepting chemotaxis protein [Gammaproteobacteria bacterium]|jgi:aerotaxis receptor|nr:methyl-accepting chemotaxis protein [Gammaproteobacteria bacterium]MBT4448562.1 methyl-accepting chemotaxis protein [Gammaproteobacteria bacterium]MBT6552739.1 methyl-accepting chemotaxis protein [Gammaproteobacteria bacterium]
MKKNLPITNKEIQLNQEDSIISTTDLKGQITYVNKAFLDISGFTENELIGKSHNIVRHPDMPPAAFKDLWETIKEGDNWRGIVKNRCENGDYYWVEAFVSPVIINSKLVGYQSVRSKASHEQINQASSLYARLNKDQSSELPKPFKLCDVSLFKRISLLLIVAAILPILGVALWSAGIVSQNTGILLSLSSPVILMFSLYFIYLSLFKPLGKISDIIRNISSGELQQQIEIRSENEIGNLFLTAKIIQARLKTVIGQISESSINVSVNADSLSQAGNESFMQMSSQLNETQSVASAISQMTSAIEEVAGNTASVSTETEDAMQEAEKNITLVNQLNITITRLVDEVENSSNVIATLNAKSTDISSIIESINSIAEQTNLLALNAAIEAARAGEQGRGFAVVADEVRTLAVRTQDATREITDVIASLQTEVKNAIHVMDKGQKQAVAATDQTLETIKSLDSIRTAINKINDKSTVIASATTQQSASSKEISETILNISRMASETLDSAQITSETGERLNQNADKMLQQFTMFDIGIDINSAKTKAQDDLQQQNKSTSTEDADVFF